MYADFMSSGLLVVGLLLAFFAWFVFGARRDAARREKTLSEFALREGFAQGRFSLELAGRQVPVTYTEFWPELADEFRISRGSKVTINHVLTQSWDGGDITLFDFEANDGRRGRAALFQSASLNLPRFLVHPGVPGVVAEWKGPKESMVMIGGITIITPDQPRVERLFTAESLAFFELRKPGRRNWAEGHERRLLY